MAEGNHLERLQTNDLELGVTDVLQRHITRYVIPPKPVSERKLRFEHARPRILRECMAEATGVFFYVYVCPWNIKKWDPLLIAKSDFLESLQLHLRISTLTILKA